MKKFILLKTICNKTLRIFIYFLIITSLKTYAQSDAIETNVPALKNVFGNDFYIGCLLSYPHVGFPTDPVVPGQSNVVAPNGGNLIKFHMNSMSPGNNMKPQYTVDIAASAASYNAAASDSERDSINTHPVVRFNSNLIAQLDWAKRQGFTFRGHTLVWHSQTPGTSFFRTGYSDGGERLTKEKMTERMGNYIKEVIRLIHENWPGLLSAMDVVNEAVNESGSDRTSDSEWHTTFGDNSYLMKAFELTRKYTVEYGETQIKLYYNDYNTHSSGKADGIVRICSPIFQAGFLDGIGMQDHDANNSPTAAQWIATYNKFDPICTEMAVTELDITTGSGNPSAALLTTQANQYGQLFKCFVERSFFSGRGKIINVSKDGLNDQYTFKTNQSSSLWTALNKCKPAFFSVVEVGINYNKLDSLVAYSDTLKENEYTTESWSNFSAAFTAAQSAMSQNYSASVSAAEALTEANDSLINAIDGLIKKITDINGVTPYNFELSQNYPNPFNPVTTINYSIMQDGYTSLKVYNLLGEEVATLFEGFGRAGKYVVSFDGNKLTSGVYFYRLQSNNFIETKKLILLK